MHPLLRGRTIARRRMGLIFLWMERPVPFGKFAEMLFDGLAKSRVVQAGLKALDESPAPSRSSRQPGLNFSKADFMIALRLR